MSNKEKIIKEYLKGLVEQLKIEISKDEKEYKQDEEYFNGDTFCYTCGNHTMYGSWREKEIKDYIEFRLL